MVQYLKKFESFERKKFSTCTGRYFGLKCHLRIIHVSANSVTFEVLIQGEVIITFNFDRCCQFCTWITPRSNINNKLLKLLVSSDIL